jgi:hypothetical protein
MANAAVFENCLSRFQNEAERLGRLTRDINAFNSYKGCFLVAGVTLFMLWYKL